MMNEVKQKHYGSGDNIGGDKIIGSSLLMPSAKRKRRKAWVRTANQLVRFRRVDYMRVVTFCVSSTELVLQGILPCFEVSPWSDTA